MRILIAEDDSILADGLTRSLRQSGYAVDHVKTGIDADTALSMQTFDLLILALGLPKMPGLDVLKRLRARNSNLPVLILTAADSVDERVKGLDLGADDYMAKPFEPRELVARIQTVLRRTRSHVRAVLQGNPDGAADRVCFEGWQLQRDERRLVSPQGTVVPLSNAEFQLLTTFLKAPRRLLTREQLMVQARGRTLGTVERSIDLLVSRLRGKLNENPRDPQMIKTVRGEGYVFHVQAVQWLGAQAP